MAFRACQESKVYLFEITLNLLHYLGEKGSSGIPGPYGADGTPGFPVSFY